MNCTGFPVATAFLSHSMCYHTLETQYFYFKYIFSCTGTVVSKEVIQTLLSHFVPCVTVHDMYVVPCDEAFLTPLGYI